MFKTPEQFAAANKATVDSLLSLANTALASAERIAALNLNTARSALEDTASGVQTVLSAKDPQAALAAQKSLAQPAVDKAVAYGKSVFEITSQTQQELAKMVEAGFVTAEQAKGSKFNTADARKRAKPGQGSCWPTRLTAVRAASCWRFCRPQTVASRRQRGMSTILGQGSPRFSCPCSTTPRTTRRRALVRARAGC